MGSKTIGSLLVRLGMNTKDADNAIKGFERKLKDVGRSMESVGTKLSVGFTAPFLLGIGKAIKAYDEEIQVVKKLEVALGKSSKSLLDQAAALQKVTTFADDQIIAEQAYAAALGHSEQQILDMTSAATGLSAGLGIDLHKAMELLHKTTTGATGGLGKLIPEIKNMTKEQLAAGEAVKLVEERFKGYAEAAALVGAGPLTVIKNQMGDLMEQIGEAAMPIVVAFTDKLKALIGWFQDLSPEVKQAAVAWGALIAAIGPLLIIGPKLVALFMGLASPVALITAGVIGLALGAVYVAKNWEALAARWERTWWTIKKVAADGINMIVHGLIGLHNMASTTMDLPMIDVASPGEKPKWNGADFQSAGEFFKDVGGDIWSLMGGDKGTQKIKEANDLIKGLGTSLDNTGDLAVDTGKKVQDAFNKFRITTPLTTGPFLFNSSVKEKSKDTSLKDLGALTAFGTIDADEINSQIANIQPGTEQYMDGVNESLKEQRELWTMLGGAITDSMSTMGQALAEGGNFFKSFAQTVILSAARLAKAQMAAMLSAILLKDGLKGGSIGAIIGLGLGIGLISAFEAAIGNMNVPAFAKGGSTYGPTLAMIGDNPSGKEMVLPFERTGEFAQMIGKQMGGGTNQGGELSVKIKDHELEFFLMRAQQNSNRTYRPTISRF